MRQISPAQGLKEVPLLLSYLADSAANMPNLSEVSRQMGIAHTTLSRYWRLLEVIFLIHNVPAWAKTMTKRVAKTPKLLFTDTGILSHVKDITLERLQRSLKMKGPLVENFVGMELLKQCSWHDRSPKLYHFRTHSQVDVDYILEDNDGKIVGIEVKASSNIGPNDLKGLNYFKEHAGNLFHRGIIFYTGKKVLPFGKNIWLVPIQGLWS